MSLPIQDARKLFSTEEIKKWGRPQGWRCCLDLSLVWIQILVAFALCYAFPHPFTYALTFLLVSGGQHGLQLASHEFSHNLVIPSRPFWNDLIGDWLFTGPGGNALALYRHNHGNHHRFTSEKRDTKHLYRTSHKGFKFPWHFVKAMLGISYLTQLCYQLNRVKNKAYHDLPAKNRRPLLAFCVTQSLIALLLCSWDPKIYLGLWLFPLFTMTSYLNMLRSSVEHLPFEHESNQSTENLYYKNTKEPFIRTVKPALWERLFFSKFNFHYHYEHHLWPQVSYQNLPAVHEFLRQKWNMPPPSNYSSTLFKMWKGL